MPRNPEAARNNGPRILSEEMMGKLFGIRSAALACCAVVSIAASAPAFAFQDEGTVRIGLLEVQTGTFAPYGLPGLWGSLIAADEINAAGGVMIDGKKVKIAVTPAPNGYDPGGDPAQNILLVKRLMDDDHVLMVKGVSASNAGVAVFNYLNELEKEGRPIVVHSSAVGAPGLSLISKWGFRNTFSEVNIVGGVAAAVKKAFNVKTAGMIITEDNPYFPSIAEKAIIPALKELGIETKVITKAVTSDKDFTRQVDELRQANVDVVYVLANTLPAINFMKEARRRGLAPKAFIGGISQLTPETLKSGAKAVEGMIMAGSYDPSSSAVASFAKEFQKRYGQDISLFAVNGHEAMYLIKDAIERSGIKNTPESLQEDRKKFRDAFTTASTTSITGEKIAFNQDRETPKKGVILHIKNGQFEAWPGGK
jgi:branched-chain amino acid transport system substrate-binding protein